MLYDNVEVLYANATVLVVQIMATLSFRSIGIISLRYEADRYSFDVGVIQPIYTSRMQKDISHPRRSKSSCVPRHSTSSL
jgi:hypothetical protein